jgi:purine-nucleoside phosphorylase
MVKMIMHGCNGKMGQVITKIVKEDANAEIVAGIDKYMGIPNDYPVFESIDKCDVEADVVIDFSNAAAVDGLLDYCVEKQVPVVLCTTGLSEEQLGKVQEASKKVAVLKSANMSLGVNMLLKLLQEAIENRAVLNVHYVNRTGDATEREFEPHTLVLKQGLWYCYAYCRLRNEFRLFKVGRIRKCKLTGENFERRETEDMESVLSKWYSEVAEDIDIEQQISYSNIPNFPVSTVEGHQGRLIFGKLGGKDIMAMEGRFHYYEGYSMKEVTFPVRVMYELGIKNLFVSNAAGGMNPQFSIGDLMIIEDQINALPENPLRGKNIPTGPRFPSMHEPYCKEYISIVEKIAAENGIKVQKGVYLATQGPTYETPAEYRMFRIWGGDAVGMSTVPEVIVAVHCGMKVFGMSIITDLGGFAEAVKVTHEEVTAAANEAQPRMTLLMKELIRRI